jgi:hypothetical protein
MNLYFLSFGDSQNFEQALSRCEVQAKNFNDDGKNIFKDIFCVNEEDIQNNFPEFFEDNLEFIKNNKRGFGYWIWKPFLIKKLMESLEDGDVILYMDSGCQFNYDAVDRLKFYYEKTLEFGGVYFRLTFPELMFTKMDTYKRVFPDKGENGEELQNCATTMMLKVSEENKKFIDEWYSICTEDSYRFVDDSESKCENSEMFVDHRHDQSIFSLLVKKYNCFYGLDDETYWPKNEWKEKSVNYPIWATRNRSNSLVTF